MKIFAQVLVIAVAFHAVNGAALQSYNCEKDTITVSGLSSGGAMAMQLHVAHSSLIKGAGILAGLPFGCAKTLVGATMCMSSPASVIPSSLIADINGLSNNGKIDNPSNLNGHPVYIFHGSRDSTVSPAIAPKTAEVYNAFRVNLSTEYSIAAQHGFPTDFYGSACGSSSSMTQYINNCNWNGAFHTLNHLYGGRLVEPTGKEALLGDLLTFEQAEFGGGASTSMDSTGFIYVPSGCRDKTRKCKFHISLHGCAQYRGAIQDKYAVYTGYQQVGEVNNIIVIFPQAAAGIMHGNPNGCWDWWGYLNANFLNRDGAQIRALYRMIQRVAFCDGASNCFEDEGTTVGPTTPGPTTPAPTTAPPGSTTTDNPNQCPPNEVIFRPFPGNCQFYTMCACGVHVLLQCAPGLYFDPAINTCNFIQLVPCDNELVSRNVTNLSHYY